MSYFQKNIYIKNKKKQVIPERQQQSAATHRKEKPERNENARWKVVCVALALISALSVLAERT